MRDDELTRLLTEANPWWAAAARGTDPTAWTAHHRLLQDRARYDLGYRSHVLDDLAAAPLGDALVVLTGPRRVGKSVALLDLAAALCRRDDVEPRQIIHVPCDGFRDRDLGRVFAVGRNTTRAIDQSEPRRRVWLLDEVSAIRGWSAVVKRVRDQTEVADDTIILSGSRWLYGEDIQGNLLAGRAGTLHTRRVRHVHPMTFRDFVAATRPDLPRPTTVHPTALQGPPVPGLLEELRYFVDPYDLSWQEYLRVGGFPRAVAEQFRTGAVSLAFLDDLAAWLRTDVDPDGRPGSLPLLLAELERRLAAPLSIRNLAEVLGFTRHEMQARLARLTSSFAGLPCPQRDEEGRLVPGAQQKFYLTDPLLAWLPTHHRAGLPGPDMTRLTEAAIGVALARRIDELEPGRWVADDTVGYTRTQNNEVDLGPVPIPTPAGARKTVPIESKWVDTGWRAEARVTEAKFGSGILATKSILDTDHPAWAIPAPILALLLD